MWKGTTIRSAGTRTTGINLPSRLRKTITNLTKRPHNRGRFTPLSKVLANIKLFIVDIIFSVGLSALLNYWIDRCASLEGMRKEYKKMQ